MVVPGQRLGGRAGRAGHGVADPGLPDVLDPGDEVAHFARGQALRRHRLGRDHAHLERVVRRPGQHHQALFPPGQAAVHHPHVGDHAPVGVIDRIEDERPGRAVRLAGRRRNLLHDGVEQVRHPLPRLGRDAQHVAGGAADDAGEFLRVQVGLGRGQVDLVQHGDQVQVGLEGQVQVGQRLRLDALGRVDQEDGPLARGQRAGHLVGEVHVTGGVDQVEHVGAAIRARPGQPDGLALDRDAALALDVHPVQVLCPHLAVRHHAGELQHAVREGGLAMVDVRDDAEVPDDAHVGTAGLVAGCAPSGRTFSGTAGTGNPPGSCWVGLYRERCLHGRMRKWCPGPGCPRAAPVLSRAAR